MNANEISSSVVNVERRSISGSCALRGVSCLGVHPAWSLCHVVRGNGLGQRD